MSSTTRQSDQALKNLGKLVRVPQRRSNDFAKIPEYRFAERIPAERSALGLLHLRACWELECAAPGPPA